MIRSSFEHEDPIIYRIREERKSSAFFTEFGTQPYFEKGVLGFINDERLGQTWTSSDSSFEPPVTGNMLGGGSVYMDENSLYYFAIDAWNVFKIE